MSGPPRENEPFRTVLRKQKSDPIERAAIRQGRPLTCPLAGFSGHNAATIERNLAVTGHNRADSLERKTQMHREDLMNADMLSEILLLVSGSVIFVTLLLILVAALTQTAART